MRPILLATMLLAGCVVDAPGNPPAPGGTTVPEPTTPVIEAVFGGSFHAVAGSTFGGEGRALMVRKLDGSTDVSISVSGGTPSTPYVAHVHAAPCQFGGGGHYMIDPALAATSTEANELWVHATSTETGEIIGSAQFPLLARGEALSVVVHDTAGKWACADLIANESAPTIAMMDAMHFFAAAEATDQTIVGTVTVARTTAATSFVLDLQGLDPAAVAYVAHVHTSPCEVNAASGHYLIDTTITTPSVDGTNEIWFPITVAATANVPVTVPFGVRTDAQAVVVHRTNALAVPLKVACANLTRMTERAPLQTTASSLLPLPASAGLTLSGTALMTRKLTGVTEVLVSVSGLEPNTTYAAHVHNQPCAADAGGGHYEFDKTIMPDPSNELTFNVTTDATGAGSDSAWAPHIAQADAESIIVHDSDGARLACFDLE